MIDGEGALTFNKITEWGTTAPVRTIDEWGRFTGAGYTYVPNDFILTPHTTMATVNRSITRTITPLTPHVTTNVSARSFTRDISVACQCAISRIESITRDTISVSVSVAADVNKEFTRVIASVPVVCTVTMPLRTFTRAITVPVSCLVTMIRDAGFVMRTAGVALYYKTLEKVR